MCLCCEGNGNAGLVVGCECMGVVSSADDLLEISGMRGVSRMC